MDLIQLILLLASIVGTIMSLSIPMDKYHILINDRCFNETYDRKPLTLGQNNPVGLSIENLISLIEKIEAKRPDFTAQQMVVSILRRFHIDGLHLIGVSNMQSPVEMKHKRVTEEIFSSVASNMGSNIDFPEDSLTEDEKCALFNTISHTVNHTARHNEEIHHIYQRPLQMMSRAPVKPVFNKTLNSTNVKKVNISAPIQSEFLPKTGNKSVPPIKTQAVKAQDSKPVPKQASVVANSADISAGDNKRIRRAESLQPKKPQISHFGPNHQSMTRRPREKGVASFLNGKETAIAMNRVLLGTAVGLLQPTPKTTRVLVKTIANINTDIIPDGEIDPLLAVTLSDLLGMDAGEGLTIPSGDVLFGAIGEWNGTVCQTRYRLKTNGTLATLAELRGGLDGWNIGRRLPQIIQKNPSISLSQILRQYYSPKGLSTDATFCNRGYGLVGELQNKVHKEAENYIRVWNGIYYENSYADNQLTGFVAETRNSFYQHLNRAGSEKTTDEIDFCNPPLGTDVKSAPLESSADMFFLLDNQPTEGGTEEELVLLTKVVKALNLGRNAGSISVLLNSQGTNNPGIVDENNVQLITPLYALAYNTTSSQCATCRAAWFDPRQTSLTITDRPLLLELINRTLMEFELKKADLPGVPSKNFIWFDFGNLKTAPTEREQKRKYEDFKWRLRYEHRDVTFFMAHLNKEDIKDLLRRDEDYIDVVGKGRDGADTAARDLINKISQTPQTFQHNECRVRKSEDKVYEGFITPGYKQYWAMYPEYFIKSYTIDIKFRAEKSRIKVCFDRYPIPEREERRCSEAKEDGGEVTWTIRNPCQGKTFESCPAFHFAISLGSQSGTQVAGGTDCIDRRCRSPDQIKWTFTHSGVSCNGSVHVLPNWTFQLICFLLFLTLFCINGKRNQYLD